MAVPTAVRVSHQSQGRASLVRCASPSGGSSREAGDEGECRISAGSEREAFGVVLPHLSAALTSSPAGGGTVCFPVCHGLTSAKDPAHFHCASATHRGGRLPTGMRAGTRINGPGEESPGPFCPDQLFSSQRTRSPRTMRCTSSMSMALPQPQKRLTVPFS